MSDQDENNTIRQMREEIRALKEANAALTSERDTYAPLAREHAFAKAGFDLTSTVGKLVAKVYDGELDPSAIQEWAKAEGIETPAEATETTAPDPVASQRADTINQIRDLRQNATPVGAVKLSQAEYKQLQLSNPRAAFEAMKAGQVEVPPHVAEALNHNSLERSNQLIGSPGGDL